ncbi:zinc finger, CCHC-type containing protein, partial [Tanacetum coccineum]
TRDDVSNQHSYFFNVEDYHKTFDEAMKSHDVAFSKEVINDEIDSIMGNNTWVLADLHPDCKPLSCKWIFKRNLKVDGTIEKFKARLVIQDFRQNLGIDYFDTYAPVARISTIRLLIAMASIHNMIIHQMDVKTTFLNGDLTKEFLSSRFSMKDMGEADVILCIRIKHGSNGIAISQSHYIEKVLKKFNYFDCTPVSTPMDTSEKQMPNNGQAVSQLEYSRVIGSLMYAMTCTRPDIAFVVGKLSRYTSNPDNQHWQAIQRVLKYLKKTMDYKLTYTAYTSVLEGYTDASWISNTEDNSSTSGWVFLLSGGVISWASKKQTCITGLTMESKFVALADAGKEAEWLKNLLLEIPLWVKPITPISIRCDNAATLEKAYSQMYNGKSRHLGVRHSMIGELITNGVISIEFVRSQQNLADHLTKGLARDLVIKSAEGMGLKGLKHMYLHIIPRMCLEPAEKEDEVPFHALRFAPPIFELGNKLTERMRSKGLYLALHLRIEKDVRVYVFAEDDNCKKLLESFEDELVHAIQVVLHVVSDNVKDRPIFNVLRDLISQLHIKCPTLLIHYPSAEEKKGILLTITKILPTPSISAVQQLWTLYFGTDGESLR